MARRRNETLKAYFPVYLPEEELQLATQLRAGFQNDNQMFRAALRTLAGLRPQIDTARLLQQERASYIQTLCTTLFSQLAHPQLERTPLDEARSLLVQLIGMEAAHAIEAGFLQWYAAAQKDRLPQAGQSPDQHQAPAILLVEDQEAHALLIEHAFHQIGFEVLVASTLADGEQLITRHLATSQPARPSLIILDLVFPQIVRSTSPGRLEGSMLAARLTEAMAIGQLHPAWIVALTSDPTQERLEEAKIAGCVRVLQKPFQPQHLADLQALLTTPAPRPKSNPMRRLSADAFPVLSQLSVAPDERPSRAPSGSEPVGQGVWGPEEVYALLFAPAELVLRERYSGWLDRRGGITSVRNSLSSLTHLTEPAHRLLGVVLAQAYVASQDYYAQKLSVSDETFRRHRKKLIDELIPVLNNYEHYFSSGQRGMR